jgi:hypothetical protein
VISVPGFIDGDVSEFIQGEHKIISALAQVLVGMKPQEKKKVELSTAEVFGPHDDRKKLNVSKTLLPPETKEGDVLQNTNGDLATVEYVTGTRAAPHCAIESIEGGTCGMSTYHNSYLHVKGVH